MSKAGKAGKAPEAPKGGDAAGELQAQLEKKVASLTKLLEKKLKVSKEAVYVITMRMLEAQFALDLEAHTPLNVDSKVAQRHEFQALASAEAFSRDELDNLLAFLKDAAPASLREHYWAAPRVTYLQHLSSSLAGTFAYLQAVSFKYSAGLKRIADCFAKKHGASFSKAWKPKAAGSVCSKLVLRRGATAQGWLSDALQGRITCDSVEAVATVAASFAAILSAQGAVAAAAGRPCLGSEPTGEEIARYDVTGLVDPESGVPLDRVITWLPDLSDEDASSIGHESVVVYRVKECACCSEVDEMEAGEVMLVNLALMLPPARRTGLVCRLPDQELACTFEIQIGTAEGFKKMARGLETHDRSELFASEATLLGKLQAIAGPQAAGKGKGGSADKGKRMLEVWGAVDVTHVLPEHADHVTYTPEAPSADRFVTYERDRDSPGSRWLTLWASQQPVFALQAITLKAAGKIPPLAKFSVLLSGVRHDGSVIALYEELLAKLPVVKSEAWAVQDGFLPSGQMLGRLSEYTAVRLEYYEHTRGFQWIDLDVSVKAVLDAAKWGGAEE